ncbi:subtilisin-like protein [Athelia psychrophila]|uniref:tripeptidyl-peptidase II n=1 Tax=Athelia psychrophila TaxID=1759441 RepID=A0A166TCN3_9AGAM|nr:subtilisin-like protein [Fibularhizoctonia sp. CBS 109695]
MLWSTVLVAALVQVCLSKELSKRWDDLSVKHSWAAVPSGWELQGPAPEEHRINLRVGLKQDKLEELIASLYEVSEPEHPKYGKHLSVEEVNALVAPHPSTLDLVDSWLTHHGVDTASADRTFSKDWVSMSVSVAQAEAMLGAKYGVYRHITTEEYVVRTTSYSIPTELHSHIDVIAPTTYFPNTRSMRANSFRMKGLKSVEGSIDAAQYTCKQAIQPSCLQTLYNSTGYTPKSAGKNKIAVAGYLEQYANHEDLQTFYKKYYKKAVGHSYSTVEINGGKNDQSLPGDEANLDVQYVSSIAFPTPFTYYSTGGSPPFKPDAATPTNTNEPYLDFLSFLSNQTTVAQTLTTSYGDDEQSIPHDYATRVCNGFAALGARGVSILFSSGDFGVGAGTCKTNNGKNDKTQFQPVFPASCPYVTAVGATTGLSPEVAANFSGGGFSNYFPAPSYQKTATASFVKSLGTKYSGLYNKTSRGYPDISAQGEDFLVIIGNQTDFIGGTSAAAPTVAGIVALLNDHLITEGKAPLGFLNPWLYKTGVKGLNDITSGANPGCKTKGFSARAGWDPVTGLGTPNFGKLQALL